MKPTQLHVIAIALLIVVVVAGVAQAGELRTTDDQRFYVNGSWVRAADLKPGDVMETYDGKRIRITNITDVTSDKPLEVYGFATNATTQSYVLADGLLTSADASRPTPNTGRVSMWRRSAGSLLSLLASPCYSHDWSRMIKRPTAKKDLPAVAPLRNLLQMTVAHCVYTVSVPGITSFPIRWGRSRPAA